MDLRNEKYNTFNFVLIIKCITFAASNLRKD